MESELRSFAARGATPRSDIDFLQGDEPTEEDIYWYLKMKEEDGCFD